MSKFPRAVVLTYRIGIFSRNNRSVRRRAADVEEYVGFSLMGGRIWIFCHSK